MKRIAAVALGLVLSLTAAREADAKVRVVLSDKENLQYMTFWVAKGAGFFQEEGLDLELVSGPATSDAQQLIRRGKGDVAVLPPPQYVSLIAAKAPIVVVARLLANDPINVIVRKEVLAARKISRDMPLKQRLMALKGLKIGVAPHPPTRLRALYRSVGLDVKDWLEIVTIHGKDQNRAFEEKKVDVLYCHTPYLERALVDQGADLLVDQSGGEVPELANRQIHALVVTRAFLEAHPADVKAMRRAIARALDLIHSDENKVVEALAKEMPKRPRKHLETIVHLYAKAVPKTPEVTVEGFTSGLFFPAGSTPPNLKGIALENYAYLDR